MFRTIRTAAGFLAILSTGLALPAQEEPAGKEEKPSSPQLLILPVGEPPVRKLTTVKDAEGNDRLENVAPPEQWVPPEKVVVTAGKEVSPEVYLQQNTLSSPVACQGAAFSILPGGAGGKAITVTPDASTYPDGAQARLQLCVLRASITPQGPDWTKPQGITFNSDWSVFPAGSVRVINMSSYPAIFQTAKTKLLIPPGQSQQTKEPVPNGTAFMVLINTQKGAQRVRQTALDLPAGTRKTMVIYDKSFDKRQTAADITQFVETP